MKQKIIILGGNNICNIEWLKKMNSTYNKDYEVQIMHFDNWKDDTDINFDLEITKLKKIMNNNDKEYIIIAKSAGALLSLIGISKGFIKPKTLTIMGLPLEFAKNKNIDVKELLNSSSKRKKLLIIQQKNDPQGHATEVLKLISKNISFVQINGNHHTYGKYKEIKEIIDNFIKQNYSIREEK